MSKSVSLKTKFIFMSLFLTISFVVILVVFAVSVYLNSIKSLEVETIETNVDRGRSVYEYLITSYNSKLNDWAQWDDTYQFMDDLNKPFISSNLNDATLRNLKVDEMLFFDTDFGLRYSIATDDVLEIEKDFPKDAEKIIINNSKIIKDLENKGESTGVVKTEDGRLMFAMQKIVKSDGTGDINGYLMFGRYVDGWIEDDLSYLVQLPVKIKEEINKKIPSESLLLDINTDEKIYGYFDIPVLSDDKNIIFEVEMERNIWKVGYQGAVFQTLIIIVLSVLVGFCNYLFLRYVILKDISKFKDDVVNLSNDTSGSSLLEVSSNNYEIRILQESVSKLINDLNIAKKESEEKAMELNRINSLMVGREIKMAGLKEIINDLKKKII